MPLLKRKINQSIFDLLRDLVEFENDPLWVLPEEEQQPFKLGIVIKEKIGMAVINDYATAKITIY